MGSVEGRQRNKKKVNYVNEHHDGKIYAPYPMLLMNTRKLLGSSALEKKIEATMIVRVYKRKWCNLITKT